jgi:plasmid maintenance system antidote protein VapI
MKKKTLHPVHPGEVLLEEFLNPMGLSQNKLAVKTGFRHEGLTRSFMRKGGSLLIPH